MQIWFSAQTHSFTVWSVQRSELNSFTSVHELWVINSLSAWDEATWETAQEHLYVASDLQWLYSVA